MSSLPGKAGNNEDVITERGAIYISELEFKDS